MSGFSYGIFFSPKSQFYCDLGPTGCGNVIMIGEIRDEDLDEDTVYIEYSKTPTGEKDSALNFVYVKGDFVVIIDLEDKSQSVDELDYLDQASSIFEDLKAN